MEDLKVIGETNLLELLGIKSAFFDIFDPVLSLLYVKRDGLTTNAILKECTAIEYNQLYRFLTQLVGLEVLKPVSDNRFLFTQKGIDLYIAISQLNFSRAQIGALSKKHALKILKILGPNPSSWNDLNRKLRIGQSSMKNALDALIEADLILKDIGGYSINKAGTNAIASMNSFAERKYTSLFELQIKFSIPSESKEILLAFIKDRLVYEDTVIQRDYYLAPGCRTEKHPLPSYLRYREETSIKPSIKTSPSHILTWTQQNNKYQMHNVWIINRSREEIIVAYPSIIFLFEYLGVQAVKRIVKTREIFRDQDINLYFDRIQDPDTPGILYVEIKSKAWDSDESERKVKIINELYEEIQKEVSVRSISLAYSEFL